MKPASARWSYERAVQYLLSQINYEAIAGSRIALRTPADVERFGRALTRLGHPEKCAPAIHIAGTNGKGSTAAMAAALLAGSGLKTGLYTSPHLVDMRERIQVNGVPVSRSEFARAAEVAKEFVGGEVGSGFRTTFELLTAMAFLVFCAREVEAQVIEVGLGGRLDSTNVIHPRVAVITSISLDHMEVLGSHVAAIATDKAQIVKRGSRAVSALQEPPAKAALLARARRVGVRLEMLDTLRIEPIRVTSRGETFRLTTPDGVYDNLTPALLGEHQVGNAALAIRAVELFLGRGLDPAVVRKSLKSVRWPGRFQILSSRPPLILDGAHNADGARILAAALDRYFPGVPVAFVVGMSRGKDHAEILKTLGRKARAMVLTGADHPRAEPPGALAGLARKFVKGPVEAVEDLEKALIRARHLAEGGAVCVAGSLYLIGDARKRWPGLRAAWNGAVTRTRRVRKLRSGTGKLPRRAVTS